MVISAWKTILANILERSTKKKEIWQNCEHKNAFSRRPTVHFVVEIKSTHNLTPEWHLPWDDLDYHINTKGIWCPPVQQSKNPILPEWPWPCPNGHDIQIWSRYGQYVKLYQKRSFYVRAFKSYSLKRQTDTHIHTYTHSMKTLPSRIRGRY